MRKLFIFLFIFCIFKCTNCQILGIDISKYQSDIDWEKVDTTIKFVIAKKSEGLTIEDSKWCQNLIYSKRPFGLYHFFRPQLSGIDQARKFLSGFHLSDIQISPIIDVEFSKSWTHKKEGANNLQDMICFIRDSIGIWPIIYTNNHFWDNYLLGKIELGQSGLWISDWRGNKTPEIPDDFKNWVIWQWTSTGRVKGIRGYVDLNRAKSWDDILISK